MEQSRLTRDKEGRGGGRRPLRLSVVVASCHCRAAAVSLAALGSSKYRRQTAIALRPPSRPTFPACGQRERARARSSSHRSRPFRKETYHNRWKKVPSTYFVVDHTQTLSLPSESEKRGGPLRQGLPRARLRKVLFPKISRLPLSPHSLCSLRHSQWLLARRNTNGGSGLRGSREDTDTILRCRNSSKFVEDGGADGRSAQRAGAASVGDDTCERGSVFIHHSAAKSKKE